MPHTKYYRAKEPKEHTGPSRFSGNQKIGAILTANTWGHSRLYGHTKNVLKTYRQTKAKPQNWISSKKSESLGEPVGATHRLTSGFLLRFVKTWNEFN